MVRRNSRPLYGIARASVCQAPFISLLFVFLPAHGLAARTPTTPKGNSEISVAADDQEPGKPTASDKSQRASKRREGFDHLQTGAPLTGTDTRMRWASVSVDHSTVTPGTCGSCHNSAVATDKPINHITTSAPCDACHTTRAWLPATFDHSMVTPGSCAACHNGITATGKSTNHMATTAACDNCHHTSAWIPVTFDHSGVAAGTCSGCHNGTSAPGKPASHIPTTASCDACHRTRAWLPATFDHGDVTSGTCTNCHNGTIATGTPDGHFVTSRACDACHTTTSWAPVVTHRHSSPFYPGEHTTDVRCKDCHITNAEVITWEAAVYTPDCAGCHSDDYEPDDHPKTKDPTKIFYTVNELRDCAGSCHEYTDNTFAIILETRTGKHRPSRSQW